MPLETLISSWEEFLSLKIDIFLLLPIYFLSSSKDPFFLLFVASFGWVDDKFEFEVFLISYFLGTKALRKFV